MGAPCRGRSTGESPHRCPSRRRARRGRNRLAPSPRRHRLERRHSFPTAILHPLPDVAIHVVEAELVRQLFADRMGLVAGVHHIPAVAAQLTDVVAERIVPGAAGLRGILPFGFGRQPVAFAGLGVELLDKGLNVIPGYVLDRKGAAFIVTRIVAHQREPLLLGDLVFSHANGFSVTECCGCSFAGGCCRLLNGSAFLPMRKVPAGITTISGQSAQSLNTLPGLCARAGAADKPAAGLLRSPRTNAPCRPSFRSP